MTRITFLAPVVAALLLASGARADLAATTADVVVPAYAKFAEATVALAAAAATDCSAGALQDEFQAAWDSWAAIDYFQLGPVEEMGRTLAIGFWPDPKSSGQRSQQALINEDSPVIDDPAAFAGISVAARGFPGLERLLYPSDITGPEPVLCRLRRATATDLARIAAEIEGEWPGFEKVLLSGGQTGNERYLTPQEAQQAVYTQLVTGLEHLADTRLGRPLGTEETPRPERAEARVSGRSLRNVAISLTGMKALAMAMQPDADQVAVAFDKAIAMAEDLDDPGACGRGRCRRPRKGGGAAAGSAGCEDGG